VRRALERAEFVVVQEAFATTATCDWADLLLPATTWGEKTGTVTNSERRISRVRPAVPKPAGARHDWAIAVEFGQRLEKLLSVRAEPVEALRQAQGERTLFPYSLADEAAGAESIWNEHRESTRGRDLDITGMSYALLDQAPLQWPMPEGAAQGKSRLYEDGVFPTADGKARFSSLPYRPVAEPRESRFPFSLTTGRLRDQWHGMSRTGTLGRLFGHAAEPCVQLHPQDLSRHGIREGDLVHVTSKRGSIVVPAQPSTELGLGQAFMAMHWGAEFLSGCSSTGAPLAGVNALTTSAFCPGSKQPELKHAAVKILKAELPWSVLAAAWLPDSEALAARTKLRELMALFPFASCVPFGRERSGLMFRAAAYEAPPQDLVDRIESLLGLSGTDALRYADGKKGQRRTMRLVRQGIDARLEGFLLAGDTSAEAWVKALLQDELPAQAYGRLLLVPGGKAPLAVLDAAKVRGKQVCTCFNVSDTAIDEQLATGAGSEQARLDALQASLKCGTNCGSCIPELKRMVRATMPRPQAA